MKTKLMLAALGTFALIGFAACDDDDDDVKTNDVPEAAQTEFDNMFPAASNVKWERKQIYYVADFRNGRSDMEAWYTGEGVWSMTETDLGEGNYAMTQLPEALRAVIHNGKYSNSPIDDADYYERPADEEFYVIEFEVAKDSDVSVVYLPDGTIVNEIENLDIEITPTTDLTLL